MRNKIIKSIFITIIVCAISMITVQSASAAEESNTAGSSLKSDWEYIDQGTEDAYLDEENSEEDAIMPFSEGLTGWKYIGDAWYYYDNDGNKVTGWKDIEGKRYYFSSTGEMLRGWQKIDDKWYYFNSSGVWVDSNRHEAGSIKGIDVSYYQEDINWQSVKEDGIQFAFIRVGYSYYKSDGTYSHQTDSKFKEYMAEANKVGIPAGVYIYSKARTNAEAIADAQFVIKNITGFKISYPVVIDLEDESQEDLSKTQLGQIAKSFCDEISRAGYTPMLYCNENWYRNFIDVSQLTDVDKWIARYNAIYSEDIERQIWQSSCTGRINGIKGNVDIDFGYKDYTKTITPRTEPVSGYTPGGYWVKNSVGWWYCHADGSYSTNAWEKIDGRWYWFNFRGYRVTGWQNINGKRYYFDDQGRMQYGWQQIEGEWYFFGGSENGAMYTGWVELNSKTYYLDKNGCMKTGWLELDNKKYYFNSDGSMLGEGWHWIDGKCYYMNSAGVMASDCWIGDYYVDASGAWIPGKTKPLQVGWIKSSGGWWYRNEDGSYPRSTWKKIDGKWYFFNSGGYMLTGWIKLGTQWYYLNSDGSMAGAGWHWIGGKCYFMYSSGVMASDTWIGGYYVDASGAWIPDKK